MEEEEKQPAEEEGEELAPMEVEEAEQPEPELSGFNMEKAEAEFAVTQSEKMAE